MAAAECRDNAHGDGLADAEGVADGQHHVAYLDVLDAPQRDRRQVLERDLEHGQVGFRVRAHDLGVGLAAIGQRNLDFIGAVHHVVVG